MAAADLVRLIDLSLGTQPCGVVNFNYLHGLLHEICKRLVQIEGLQGTTTISLPPLPEAMVESTKDSAIGSAKDTDSAKDSAKDSTKDFLTSDSSAKDSSAKDSSTNDSSAKDSSAKDSTKDSTKDFSTSDSSAKDSTKDSTKDFSTSDSSAKDSSAKDSSANDSSAKDSSAKDSTKDSTNSKVSVNESSDEDNGIYQMNTPLPTPSRRTASGGFKCRSSFVSAANDLGALERKLLELESRINTMESLPDLLEKKSSDSQSTPASDLWNFTSLTNRIGASEEGLDKAFSLIDDLLGEINGTREQVDSLHSNVDNVGQKLSGGLKSLCSLEGKMGSLEGLKLAGARDSMGDVAASMLSDLTNKTRSLEDELSALKASLEGLPANISSLVSREDLSNALSEHDEVLQQRHEVALKNQSESLASLATGLAESRDTIGGLDEHVTTLREELDQLKTQVQETEAALSTKVNTLDLTSLMPQGGSDEGPSLMPKLLEMQTKLSQVEAQLASTEVPSDKLAMMQNAIDRLQSQLSTFASSLGSSAEDRNKVEELGSLVAQLRERMADLDRAVTAVSNAVSLGPREALPEVEADGAGKYVDLSSFEALQDLLGQLHSEQERLIGTAAHLSHEVGVSKEHVKTLYGNVDELKDMKADKELMEVEVRGKADKNALDTKASRDWVDSTFERFDREIRDAASKLLGHEEALRSAMNQLGEDVEGKLDRLELEPLKDYFDKKLERVKPAAQVAISEAMRDDAAGFKTPLRVRCISCDKPVGVKQLDAIPTLPAGGLFPDTRSFRPYTTYELELIRRHQKIGSPMMGSLLPIPEYPRSIRSAGGIHTKTRPHQRLRVAPLGQGYIPEATYTPPPPPRHSPSVHDELEIVGHDGHVYKGRSQRRSRLPPLATTTRSAGRPRVIRPPSVAS